VSNGRAITDRAISAAFSERGHEWVNRSAALHRDPIAESWMNSRGS